MTESRNNTFSMLVDEENSHGLHDGGNKLKDSSSNDKADGSSKTTENDDTNWTVQQSARNKRLAPSWNLTRHDLGTENANRGKSSQSNESIAPAQNQSAQGSGGLQSYPKKKVLRYSRDELLSRRRRTAILQSMANFTDIISIPPLDPIALNPLQADEIQKLWNFDRNKDTQKRKIGNKKDDDDAHAGMWDDAGGSLLTLTSLDLEDIAAAALKFQSETMNLSQSKDILVHSEPDNEDEIYEDDEEIPEWARDDVLTMSSNDNKAVSTNPVTNHSADLDASKKKFMIMEALQIQPNPDKKEAEATAVVEDAKSSVQSVESVEPKTGDAESIALPPTEPSEPIPAESVGLQSQEQPKPLSLDDPLPLFTPLFQNTNFQAPILPVVDEWYYTDPQNNVQGPFTTENMKAWHEAGYFTPDLPVKMKNWVTFHQLSLIFPVYVEAFRSQPAEPLQSSLFNVQYDQQLLEERRLLQAAQEQQQRTIQAQEQQRLLQIQEQQRLAHAQEQQRLQQEREKQHRMIQEQRLHEQALIEKLRQQQMMQEQQRRDAMEQQRRHLEMEEVARQRQQQEILLDEKRRQEMMYFEAEKIKREYEEKKYQEQLHLEQQRQMEEHRRQQEYLIQEQRRKEEQQKRIEEQYRFEREKQREYLEEQRRQHEKYLRSIEGIVTSNAPTANKPVSSSVAPWATNQTVTNEEMRQYKDSLVEIQKREEEARLAKQREAATAKQNQSSWLRSQQTSSGKSLLEIQMEEQKLREEKEALARQNNSMTSQQPSMSVQLKSILGLQNKPGSMPWSTNQETNQQGSNLSLRTIMEQEERQMQYNQTRQYEGFSVKAPPAGSWAAKAMSTAPNPPPPQYMPQPKPVPTRNIQPPTILQSQQVYGKQQSGWMEKPMMPRPMSMPYTPEEEDIMPREISEWCESQLRRMNSPADLSLLHVCYSLQSAGEIREYLAELLGSTAHVSQFATEFIKRKEQHSSVIALSKKKKK